MNRESFGNASRASHRLHLTKLRRELELAKFNAQKAFDEVDTYPFRRRTQMSAVVVVVCFAVVLGGAFLSLLWRMS